MLSGGASAVTLRQRPVLKEECDVNDSSGETVDSEPLGKFKH